MTCSSISSAVTISFSLPPNIALSDAVTTLNGVLIPSGKRVPLQDDDTLQFGKTQLKVKVTVQKGTGLQK